MAEFIGGAISTDVKNQLLLRSKALGASTSSERDVLLKEQLFSTAFVNVISSVDVEESNDPTELGSNLAKNHVLSGGLYRWEGKQFIKREGFNFTGSDFTSAYKLTTNYGVRPVPGITSFSVQSKGTYGTIRDATIQFSVYSLDDLEVMEKLYLRPGFTVVVEWGHTAYLVENNGQPQVTTNLASVLSKKNNLFTQRNIDDVENELRELKKVTGYNYDSFIGYIKNFSYKFNKEGGYDCSISIISKGEILDSLTANAGGSPASTPTEDEQSLYPFTNQINFLTKFVGSFSRKIFSQFSSGQFTDGNELKVNRNTVEKSLKILENFARKDARRGYTSLEDFLVEQEKIREFVRYAIEARGGKDYLGFAKSLEYTESDVLEMSRFATVYFPLDIVLSLFNYYLIKINSGLQPLFHVNQTSRYFKYNTFSNHISIKPKVGVLPKRPESPCWSDLHILRSPFEKKEKYKGTIGPFFNDLISGDYLDIRNIHISNLYLDEIFRQYTNTSLAEKSNFRGMVKQILDDLSDALGGINEFDIEYDDESNYYYIVDRAITGIEGSNVKSSEIPTIPLAGLAGITTDITVESKITKDLANKISIAAQSRSSDFNEYVASYREWRQGLVDRYSNPKPDSTKNDLKLIEEEEKKEKERIKSSKNLLDALKNSYYNLRIKGHLYESDWESLPGMASSLFKRYVELDTTAKGKPPKGVIPLELSFTLKGISGFKIGQSFKIQEGLLPAKYSSEDFGFIVTGIDNSISSGTWFTTIKALTYITGKPERKDIQLAQEELNKLFICPEIEVFTGTSIQNVFLSGGLQSL